MIDFTQMIKAIQLSKKQHTMIYNYTIPQAWNTFGFERGKRLRNHEMIVDPHDFYSFALTKMAESETSCRELKKEKGKHGSWIEKEVIYALDMRTLTSWDHDRNDAIDDSNLYGLNDSGTFLKAIILLPLLKRSGITTVILHQLFELDQPRFPHDYAHPYALKHPLRIASALQDPLLSGIDVMAQFQLFMQAAHHYGFRVICNSSPARLGRDNELLESHPDWFYWIKKDCEAQYCAPIVKGLPNNCLPGKNACKLLYQQDTTQAHLDMFAYDPETSDPKAYQEWRSQSDCCDLAAMEKHFRITSAPMFSDQLNTSLPIQKETTYLRFYRDQPIDQAPYLLQDTLRPDLFAGKHANEPLWDFICSYTTTLIEDYQFDGLFIDEVWLLPQKLLKAVIQNMRKQKPQCAILVNCNEEQAFTKWRKLGVNVISGNSAYMIHDDLESYRSFAYSRLNAESTLLAAGEFIDTPRAPQYQGGEAMAKTLMFMNLFLPHSVPYYTSGQLSLAIQPQFLSPYADPAYQNALPTNDIRCHKQAFIDKSYYTYTRGDYHILINQMEHFTKLRRQYLPAMMNDETSIPVWFDKPNDPGIGFTYTLADRALLVVCNIDVKNAQTLTIHTENMLWELPFIWKHIYQIYSSHDPYTHDIELNAFQNIPLYFEAGEVKILEIREE